MKYYAAVGDHREIRSVAVMPPVRMLMSYHYFKNKIESVQEQVEKKYDVFIDSGAFSAMSSGKEIDIDEYCKFIIDSNATMYAGLDVIGDAKQTSINVAYMEKTYGLKPIPTFHMGSKLEDLESLMNYSYIALGGLVYSPNVINHCDRVWHYILTHNPKIKVHGFGVTNVDIMGRYPWTSIDSSTYKQCRRFGRQPILWNGFEFRSVPEKEYQQLLVDMGYKIFNPDGTLSITNPEKYHIYDFNSVMSYKYYALHLEELNKHKDFSYLNSQQTLF